MSRAARITPGGLLVARLRAQHPELPLPDRRVWVQRLWPSRADRTNGAWSWALRCDRPDDLPEVLPIGSQWPVTHLVRCKLRWDVNRDELLGDWHIDPDRREYAQPEGRRR
jgi:hypothetical protein